MQKDLIQAIQNFRGSASRYARTERYYRGLHDLAFATKKFENAFGSLFREFALNLCPAVCDAIRDKLKVTGFSLADPGKPAAGAENLQFSANRVWGRNRMGVRGGEVHKEVLKNGDAYLIVWPDAEGNAAIYPNRAANVTVEYDEERPGRVRWAAKHWLTAEKRHRLNLFYPDRIATFISENASEFLLPDAKSFRPSGEIANPFGTVPVFHFANNADVGACGNSELDAAIPVQDGLNKSVLDMLVAMEYSAYRQRWAAGIELEEDGDTGNFKAPFQSGVDHVWVSSNPETTFGDFRSADLEQFLKVKESFRIDVACVTGTPLHYLQPMTQGFPSGESLRKAESRFLAKVRDRQEAFGDVWAEAMSFALRIETGTSEVRLETEWEDPAAISSREKLENILLKKQIGLSTKEALAEAGYKGELDVSEE
jgi:hypothetical protein